jgi:hypothetical protein
MPPALAAPIVFGTVPTVGTVGYKYGVGSADSIMVNSLAETSAL